MAEVGSTSAAHDLGATHAIAVVFIRVDIFFGDGFVKAWPARSGIIFCIRIEQLVTACGALIYAWIFCLVILACEWTLRSFHAANLILLRSKLLFPLLVGFLNFVFHVSHCTSID